MKLGVSSYSYSALMREGKMTQFDIIGKAKEMGFDMIEFAGIDVPDGEDNIEFAKKLHEKCVSENIEMGNYSISADFLYGSNGNLDDEIERLKREIKVARALGAPGMRHDATYGYHKGAPAPRGFADALPRLIKGCRAVTDYAAEYGIKTMVENHGFFSQDSARVEALVNGVASQNFGVLVDIGNFLCADEDPVKAVGELAPYAVHVHVKDFHIKSGSLPNPGDGWFTSRAGNFLRGAIVGHGEVPVTQCLRLLFDQGYNNSISVEFEGIEDPIKGIAIGFQNLKNYIASLGK